MYHSECVLFPTPSWKIKRFFFLSQLKWNEFCQIFHESRAFYGAIIGAKGAVKKRIEGETRTEITIPKHGTTGDIEILGSKRESVGLACRRIESIVINSRRKQRPTHFTCVRVIDPTIKNNAIKFKVKIDLVESKFLINFIVISCMIIWFPGGDFKEWTDTRLIRKYVYRTK